MTTQPTVRSFVFRIRRMSAPALARFIEGATAMVVNGEVDPDFADWVEVALERLDELADEQSSRVSMYRCIDLGID